MPGTVKRLREVGVKCAVASNKPDDFSQAVVRRLYGEGLFDLVRGKREGVPVKPAPDIVYSILEELGASAEETVFIGDSSVDVLTARNSGLPCIGVDWGFRRREELAGADRIVSTCDELAEAINS